MSNIICLLGKNILVLQESSFCKQKSLPPRTYLCKRRKTLCPTRYHSYFMKNHTLNGYGITPYIPPGNGGSRLRLLLPTTEICTGNFKQLLQGEFYRFLPLSYTDRQLSALWFLYTIPYQSISLIILWLIH